MSYKRLDSNQVEELKKFSSHKSNSAQECLRALAVLLIDQGLVDLVREMTGYTRGHAFTLRSTYIEQGIRALITKKRNEKHYLTKGQLGEVIHMIKTTTPDQLGYPNNPFWATSILGEIIFRDFGVKYKSKTSLYLIFKDAKFTYHKPGQVYKNRDQNKVDQWKQHVLPVIQEYLKKKNTVVLTEDEMILSTQTTFQKIWLSANSYPKIEVSNNRKRRSIYGFLNLKTGKEHAFKAEAQTGEITVEMLEKVRRIYPNKKIIIVWDNAPWHRSKVVKEYLAKKGHNINLIPFPPYNPEDNPQEHVWKRGREMVTHNKFIEDIDTATDQFVDWLNSTTFEYSLSTI